VQRCLTRKQDLLAVGRPPRAFILEGVIRNFGQRAPSGGNYPDVGVVAVVVGFPSAIRNESDACAVGRPLRIDIVPILPIGDLPGLTARHIDNPEVPPFVVKPSSVIEFVLDVRIVAHIAVAVGWRCGIAGPVAVTRTMRLPSGAH